MRPALAVRKDALNNSNFAEVGTDTVYEKGSGGKEEFDAGG
jgi:hypothetical protein